MIKFLRKIKIKFKLFRYILKRKKKHNILMTLILQNRKLKITLSKFLIF